jgi:outer membrane protein assembly factor BamB
LWQDPDAHVFALPAHAAGVVYAIAASPTGPSSVGAWDADSGASLWSHELADAPVFMGPVVADGIVVVPDDTGLVTAYDALSGDEVWHLQARNPLGGAPVVHDGRVVITERVTAPDVTETDVRVSAHDLRTGRLLAAWEPTRAPVATTQPLVSAGPAGQLLYPTYFGMIEVELR